MRENNDKARKASGPTIRELREAERAENALRRVYILCTLAIFLIGLAVGYSLRYFDDLYALFFSSH